jgi:hypothetical protein
LVLRAHPSNFNLGNLRKLLDARQNSKRILRSPSIATNFGGASMADLLRFHPLVADDLSAATEWYDSISVELGNRFRADVNSRLDAVELRPESFAIVDAPLRAARAGRYPYLIVFEHSRLTEVLGVFHSASDPSKWRGRLR